MRKLIAFLIAFSLILSLSSAVLAADDVLTIEDTAVKSGETIYLSVTLNQSLTADAIGVRYSYDKALLEPLPASAIWEVQGLLSDFNNEDSGVWASAEPKALSGRLFTLAFRLKEGATLTESTVSCTVIFKNGDSQGVEHTATGRLYVICNHIFGKWSSNGVGSHSRACTLCEQAQIETHNWDSGKRSDHPNNGHLDLITYICTVCGEIRSTEVAGDITTILPTAPTQATEPTPTLPTLETVPPHIHETVLPTIPPPIIGTPDIGNQNNPPSNPTTPTNHSYHTQPTQPTEPAPGYNAPDYNNSNSQNNTNNQQTNTEATAPIQPTTGNTATTATAPTSGSVTNEHSQGQYQSPVAVTIPSEIADLFTQPATESVEHDHDHDHTEESLSPEEQATLEEQQAQTYKSSGLALLAAFACIGGAAALTGVLIRRNKK